MREPKVPKWSLQLTKQQSFGGCTDKAHYCLPGLGCVLFLSARVSPAPAPPGYHGAVSLITITLLRDTVDVCTAGQDRTR